MPTTFNVAFNDLSPIMAQIDPQIRKLGGIVYTPSAATPGTGTLYVPDAYVGLVQAAMAAEALAASHLAALLEFANGQQELVLAQLWSFDVGASGSPMVCTTYLDAAGRASMDNLCCWAIANSSIAGATEPYFNVDKSSLTLTPTQALSLYTRARAIQSQSRATLLAVTAAINATPPTITDTPAIVAAAWPTP